jgi:flagellar protein FlaG
MQESDSSTSQKINSKEQVRELVDQLNKAMAPMNTNIKFGVDSQDVFYVSVIESDTSKMIRRFPAEKAADILPKMQEVTGTLFDSKG